MRNNRLEKTLISALVVISGLMLGCGFSLAEDLEIVEFKPVKQLSLGDSIRISLDKNRDILQEKESNTIYRFKLKEQATYFLPQLGVTNDYQFNSLVKQVAIPNLPHPIRSFDRNQTTTSVGISQPLGGLFATGIQYKIAKENLNISLLQTELEREITINDVAGLYFDILKQYKIIDLNKQNIEQLKGYYKVAKDRFNQGEALARDYLKIDYEIESAKHDLLVQEDTLRLLYYNFKDTLGIDMYDNIEVMKDFHPFEYQVQPTTELMDIAMQNRPEIEQASKNIKIAKLNRKLSITEFIPEVNFFGGYYHITGQSFAISDNFLFGVSTSYTLWDWNKRGYSIREAKSNIRIQELQYESLKNQIFLQIQSQLNAVNESCDMINVSKKNVEVAQETLRITTNRYKVGMAMIIDLLDDQTNLLNAEVDQVSSQLDYQKDIVGLKKVIGTIDQEF